MKRLQFFIMILLCGAGALQAQTTLSAGDVVNLEFNGNGNDGFSFMPLVNLQSGTASTLLYSNTHTVATIITYETTVGTALDMDENDLTGLTVLDPNSQYIKNTQPSDGTHTATISYYYGGVWYTKTYNTDGWSGERFPYNDDFFRFQANNAGVYTFLVALTDDDHYPDPILTNTIQVTVTGGNTAPVATAPSAPTVNEDATNVALANDIQVTDTDGDNQTVAFTVTGGTVTLGTVGITFGGSGNGSSGFTAAGILADINTALDAATFTPTPDLNGTNAGTISFVTNDGTVSSSAASVTFNITAIDPPTVTTTVASSIASTSAALGGNVTADGGATVTGRGVVYSSSDDTPTIGEPGVTQNTNGDGIGEFNEAIGSLSPGTTYYFQTYATNSEGTAYGGVETFTTTNASITFTSGTGFTPSITKGNTDQVFGRFQLSGDVAGSSLTAASIQFNGTRTGLSNLKLWSSTDATFESGSDTQLAIVSSDPGDGSSAAFSSFSNSIATGGTYYFLTGDVASDATGSVQGVIVENSSLTLSGGSLTGTIANAPLSNGDASLPVSLVSFSARAEGRSVILTWITESETDNLGFILERSVGTDWQPIATYQTHDELKGQGNTSSRTEYTFTDENVESGKAYSYRLSDVSTKGEIAMYASLSVKMDKLPATTEMKNAYPNPFNPQTYITYNLSEDTDVNITVFDMLGRQVKVLYNGHQVAGIYNVYWNATDETGNKAPSGGYIIQMKTEKSRQTQKVMLMK